MLQTLGHFAAASCAKVHNVTGKKSEFVQVAIVQQTSTVTNHIAWTTANHKCDSRYCLENLGATV